MQRPSASDRVSSINACCLIVVHPENVTMLLVSWLGKDATPGWKHVPLLSSFQVVRAVLRILPAAASASVSMASQTLCDCVQNLVLFIFCPSRIRFKPVPTS